MRRSMTFALLFIVAAAAIGLGATLASGDTPRLGLDLQGGASVVLTPKTKTSGGALNQAQNIITQRVNGLGVAGATIQRQGSNIVVELPGVKNASTALSIIGQTAQLEFRPVVLDQNGQQEIFAGPGPSLGTATSPTTTVPTLPRPTLAPLTTAPAGPATTKGALGTGHGTVAAAALTAAVPAAPAAPGPGAQTAATAAPAPGAQTATTPAPAPATTAAPATTPPTLPPSTAGPPLTPQSVLDNTQAAMDQTLVLPECSSGTSSCQRGDVTARYVVGPVLKSGNDYLTGRIVATAQPVVNPTTGEWTVNVTFTSKGGAQWDQVVAGQYYQKYVAIVLDNKVISAPQIQAKQFNGQATISGGGNGGFTHSQASQLALVLRYGSLPVQLQQSEVRTISASLGRASLKAGLIAGLIGLSLVLIYMILYYRALGMVAVVGLGLSGVFLYCLFAWLGNSGIHESLSLASIVGVIVSIGVTADSYIVYFERLKDDVRGGRTVRSSVDRSFARAWRTIWTADLVAIIAAALLFWLTIGDVRGFAFSLGLSTALDMITVYTFTRPLVSLLARNRTFAEARVIGVARGLAATPTGGAA